jgi:hypothetical protein
MMLIAALHKHYGIEPKPRAGKKSPSSQNLPRIEPPRSLAEIGPITPLSSPLPPLPPPPPLRSRPLTPPPPPMSSYDPHRRPSSLELDRVAGYLDDEPALSPLSPRSGRITMRELAAQMFAAGSEDLVLECALRYLSEDAQRLVALAVQSGRLLGLRAHGVEPERLRLVNIAVEDSPLVATVLGSGETWAGRVFPHELGGALWPLFGSRGETLGFVLPVRIARRAAGVIVGLRATNEALRNKPDFDRMAQKLDYALQIAGLRRQLLDD